MPYTRQANNFRHYPRKQHGAALMVMLVIMVMGAATFLVSSLSKSTLKIAQQETTSAALAQAKEALIGYAVGDVNRPGELPCPDTDNDGSAEMLSGTNCSGGNFGRLPWKTLGLPDLRDAAGERLWYAVSDAFHAGASAPLNSNTAGTLTVSGNVSANNVIAIVFASGQNLPGQDRSAANINTFSAYLESVVTSPTSFNLLTPDDQPGGGHTYNDQLRLITHDDLFPSVEKVAGNEFKKIFNAYYAAWGALPFATASKDTYGLLPINGNAASPYWSNIQETGAGSASCQHRPSGCTGSSCTYARCSSYSGLSAGDVVVISGTIERVGMGFWRLYNPATGTNKTSSCTQEVCVRVTISGNNWYYPASSVMNNVSITGSLNSNGQATITFTGTVKSGYIPNRIQFSTSGMPDYSSTLLDSEFVANDWQDVMYYAVSPGYIPGGGSACNPLSVGTPPYCLTLEGSGAGDNIPVAIIMTGRSLSGQSRPSANAVDYLESGNATTADYIYENKTRSSAFNDQVIVVAP